MNRNKLKSWLLLAGATVSLVACNTGTSNSGGGNKASSQTNPQMLNLNFNGNNGKNGEEVFLAHPWIINSGGATYQLVFNQSDVAGYSMGFMLNVAGGYVQSNMCNLTSPDTISCRGGENFKYYKDLHAVFVSASSIQRYYYEPGYEPRVAVDLSGAWDRIDDTPEYCKITLKLRENSSNVYDAHLTTSDMNYKNTIESDLVLTLDRERGQMFDFFVLKGTSIKPKLYIEANMGDKIIDEGRLKDAKFLSDPSSGIGFCGDHAAPIYLARKSQ